MQSFWGFRSRVPAVSAGTAAADAVDFGLTRDALDLCAACAPIKAKNYDAALAQLKVIYRP
jgi:hypothetical protein